MPHGINSKTVKTSQWTVYVVFFIVAPLLYFGLDLSILPMLGLPRSLAFIVTIVVTMFLVKQVMGTNRKYKQ